MTNETLTTESTPKKRRNYPATIKRRTKKKSIIKKMASKYVDVQNRDAYYLVVIHGLMIALAGVSYLYYHAIHTIAN